MTVESEPVTIVVMTQQELDAVWNFHIKLQQHFSFQRDRVWTSDEVASEIARFTAMLMPRQQ